MERAFGVRQSRFTIIWSVRNWHMDTIKLILLICMYHIP